MKLPFTRLLHFTARRSAGASAAPSAAACSPAGVASTHASSAPIVRPSSTTRGLLLLARMIRKELKGCFRLLLASAMAAAMLLVLLAAGCNTVYPGYSCAASWTRARQQQQHVSLRLNSYCIWTNQDTLAGA
jgi:hypothetical protein